MFCSTVSQGKTPFSWNTKMRRRSGPRTGSPSTSTAPALWRRKPPITLSSVDFPQPEGPTMQTNSPRRTSRSTSRRTWIGPPPFPGKSSESPRTATAGRPLCSALLMAPRHLVETLEPPKQEIEAETDHTDQHHPRDHEVVALARVAGVDDQVPEPRVDRDHLRGDDHEPRHPERDPHAGQDLRQRGRQDHAPEQLGAREPEVAGGAQVHGLHVVARSHGGDGDREDAREEDQEDRRRVAHAEPEDGDRDPGDGRDRTEHLDQGIEGEERALEPAEREARGDPDGERQGEAAGHPEERRHHVLREQALLRELDDAAHD